MGDAIVEALLFLLEQNAVMYGPGERAAKARQLAERIQAEYDRETKRLRGEPVTGEPSKVSEPKS